jgi:ParB family chromosome partitioning protein
MLLKHIDLAHLSVSPTNMRAGRKVPDIANILASVRARGVLVPLIVRQKSCPEPAEREEGARGAASFDTYEIVAGRRRFHAALAVAEEGGASEALPCAVIDAGDDAAALEASLIENIARLDPDEVSRWECFTRLVREGRTPEEIGQTFGLTDLQVKRTLALGNLMPRIRSLYRAGEIDAATVRHLTLASKAQQREWLALRDDKSAYCPTGVQLKAWLFGGASIPVSAAVFDVAAYPGETVSDLFGDERWFADVSLFWTHQNAAVAAMAGGYREADWAEVVVLEPGDYFHSWEHVRTPKRKGGKVFIALDAHGAVTVHEGFLTAKDARRAEKGEPAEKPVRPEVSAPLANYIDLHRHAAVRASLASQPSLALRVMVAHAIAGSGLWSVRVEPQRALSDAIAESVENSPSKARFDERRRAVLAVLGFDADTPTVTGGCDGRQKLASILTRLIALPDAAVFEIAALVMAETLEAGSPLIEMLGALLGIDMADVWQPDDVLLDLIRDREVLAAVLSEVAGNTVATGNAKATGKVKRGIVRDCLKGDNGRAKVERWVPRWMAFPPSAYTDRGGVPSVAQAAKVADLTEALAAPEPVRIAA